MNLPLLLLGLYSGLLVLALVLASWVGHNVPPPEAVRRVADAGDRAALLHLVAPAKLALGALLLLGGLGATSAFFWDGPTMALAFIPVLGPSLVLGAIYFSCRKLLRASSQVVSGTGADQRLSVCSRSLLGAVLCCEATVSLVLLGVYTAATASFDASVALRLVLMVAVGVGLSSVIFARSSAGAIMASDPGAQAQGPHPGSLALLVAHGFHAPGLRLVTLVTLSALGHCVLLVFSAPSTETQNLWLYPHLLRAIGLIALCFGNMVVRTTEGEQSHAGWIRGALVSLSLLVAGAWSLSAELPDQWARPVASGLTFFFLVPVIFLWVSAPFRSGSDGFLVKLLSQVPAALSFFALVTVLTFAVDLLPADVSLPNDTLLRLIAAAALSLTPISVVWLIARDMNESYRHVEELSYLKSQVEGAGPSPRFANLFPALTLTALACALGGMLLTPDGASSSALLQTLGWMTGALVLWGLLGISEKGSLAPMRAIAQLLAHHRQQSVPSNTLNLELAVESSRQATLGGIPWTLMALGPTLIVFGLSFLVPAPQLKALALGLALGATLLGIGLDWALGAAAPAERRVVGALSHVTGIVQALWLIALGMHLS